MTGTKQTGLCRDAKVALAVTDDRDEAEGPFGIIVWHFLVSAVVTENGLRKGARVVLEQAPPAEAPAEHRPRAVRQRAERAEQLLRHAEQPGHAEPQPGAVADHHGEPGPHPRLAAP